MTKFCWELKNDVQSMEQLIKNRETLVPMKPKLRALESFAFSDVLISPIIERIFFAIQNKEKILICGDYDVDGITATAILYRTLQTLEVDNQLLFYSIPDRFKHGYGLHQDIICEHVKKGVQLIITVDNGIAANEAISYARKQDIDVIVTDHHDIPECLPETSYILHPQLDAAFTSTPICGAGVAFLLAKKLLSQQMWQQQQSFFLQLTTLGTLADMMPLTGINRILTYHGFQEMQRNPAVFLQAFLRFHQLEKIQSDALSFLFIPEMNAVGRLDVAEKVVDFLLTNQRETLDQTMKEMAEINEQRKKYVDDIIDRVDEHEIENQEGFVILYQSNWHQGVLGIAAQRLMQKFQKPMILLTESQNNPNIITGSIRSFGCYDVIEFLKQLKKVMLKSGGHQYAGGLSIKKEQLSVFKEKIRDYNKILEASIGKQKMSLTIDGQLQFPDLGTKFVQQQDLFAPYGMGNQKFNILLKNCLVIQLQYMGNQQSHCKLTIQQMGKKYQIVCFHYKQIFTTIALYSKVDVVVQVQQQYYMGRYSVQYFLQDIRLPQKQIFDYRQQKFSMNYQDFSTEKIYEITMLPQIQELDKFIANISADQIEAIYLKKIEDEQEFMYAKTIPKSTFSLIYKYLYQKKEVHLLSQETLLFLKKYQLPKSIFLCIIQVFFELNFVIIDMDICRLNSISEKVSLDLSVSYQKIPVWLKIRNLILYEPIESLYEYLEKRKEEQI